MYYDSFPIANIVKWSHRHLDSLNCQTMKVKPYIILNTSKKHVNYEELVSKIAYHQSCSSSLPEYIWSPMRGVWNSSHSKFCRSTSCYLEKHNLVMAPKASLTYLPTTQAWRPLALAPPECGSFRPVSHFPPIPVCPGSFCPHLLIVL
jgi:hypothetical protein